MAEVDVGDIPDLLAVGPDLQFTGSLAGERDRGLYHLDAKFTACTTPGTSHPACSSASSKPGAKSIVGQRLNSQHEMDP